MITADLIRPFVEKALCNALDINGPLVSNEDGSIPVGTDDASYFVKVIDTDPPRIRFESVMVRGLPEHAKLLKCINQLNDELDYGRVFWHETCVYFEFDLLTDALSQDAVADACRLMTSRSKQFSELIQSEFGGERPGDEPEAKPSKFGNEIPEPEYL